MATGTNYIITYNDLVEYAITKIKSLCANIDSFKSNVPAQYKDGGVVIKASKYWPRTYVDKTSHITQRSEHTSVLTATTTDTSLVIVPTATVNTDINNFMQSRGLYTKENVAMSLKTIINFFNNLSAFLSVKLWTIYSPIDGTRGIIFYNKNSVAYPNVSVPSYNVVYTGKTIQYSKPSEPYNGSSTTYETIKVQEVQLPTSSNTDLTDNNIQSSVQDFMSSMNSLNNVHQALITLSYACSSCSSSSSSSSSSCSSSSSSFIVYMDI